MSRQSQRILNWIGPAALLAVVWVSFFLLQGLASVALSPRRTLNGVALVEVDVTIGLLWAVLSVGIAAWHRRVRAAAPDLVTLIAAHTPVLLVAALLDCVVTRAALIVFTHPTQLISFWAMLALYADLDLAIYVLVVATAEILLVRRALRERQRQAERLEASLSRARLDYLEAQLQPHFLFNSLGAVSELAFETPAVAGRVIRQLTAIFRTALAKKTDEVTLGEEIVGIEPYLDIQRIRFADWLTIDYQIDDAAVDCLVPRFVLQPLIENAIRHGLSGRNAAGSIEISAAVKAESLVVRVADNGVGLDAVSRAAGRGIGLANVRDRLLILYGDDDRLRLASGESGGTVAELTIPARRRVSPRSETHGHRSNEDSTPSDGDKGFQPIRVPSWLRKPLISIGVVWCAWGIIWAQQSFISLLLRERLGESTWLSILGVDMLSAMIWALLTPLVLAFARRVPIRRESLPLRLTVYAAAGASTSVLHLVVWRRLAYPQTPLWSGTFQSALVIGVLIFFIIAAVAHREVLVDWLRAREAAARALRVEVERAQQRAAKLQLIPPILLGSLEGIAETVRRDPVRTERQLTRLADYLRVALECSDERGMTPERERALEGAVAALRQSGAYSLDFTMSA